MSRGLLFVTSNMGKFSEAQKVLKRHGINIAHKLDEIPEVRAEDCATVAEQAAVCAYEKYKQPLFVEDTGLFIESLGGFPGIYSAYVYKKIGMEGVLRLLEGKNRIAVFVSCIGYADGNGVRVFRGECRGKISKELKGKDGFGYDPVFIPVGFEQTFAENPQVKDDVSHRKRALMEFVKFLEEKGMVKN